MIPIDEVSGRFRVDFSNSTALDAGDRAAIRTAIEATIKSANAKRTA